MTGTWQHGRLLALAGAMVALAACGAPDPAPVAAAPPATPEATAAAAGPSTAMVHTPVGTGAGATHACMIAGEFQLLGQVIRSRDCVQTAGATTEAQLKRVCEGLAQTSAQMGGKAGEITYMEACPAPSQGSCQRLFGQDFDGYYYERSAEDLAGLPASCAQGGGHWKAE